MLRPRCRDLRLGRLEKFVQNLAAERQVNTSERRHDVGREESGAALSSTNQSCMLPNSSLGSAPIVIHNLFCCFDGYKAGEPDIVAGAGTDLHKNVCVCVCVNPCSKGCCLSLSFCYASRGTRHQIADRV